MSESLDINVDTVKLVPLVIPPDSPKKPVKSTAVVKYSAVQTLATYAQLHCNTDLNLPPSNWLSSSAESYGLQSVWSQTTGFSSFRMAHMFPDCVGEVDVVSDAENIKKLLKLPYNRGMISMMVHRIENTLLLDDFDIHKYLLRQAENDWEWLKKFFYEHIFHNLGEKEKCLFHKTNNRNTLQQRNLVSKFLYHSIVVANDQEQYSKPQVPVKTLEPCLPEPSQEEKVPDPNYKHNFARNIVWTFENIHMLIGTDMPIFGGQTHPCISLRLSDMTKPINVLTGIDYWLDNLMCNVPEVVMCYHLDGIVQKYELIKTEDLPNLHHSKFSPKVIRDIAQNILSFLKNNATKAGHTYWLFKGKDDDAVKLYDLTSLCHDVSDDKGQNTFTVPVAMLLYRVARNMKHSSDHQRQQGTIRMLLKYCIQLLTKEKYPQIVTSAHFMLSDLYIPLGTDPANPGLSEQSDDEDTQSETSTNHETEKDEKEEAQEAAIKSLMLANIKEHTEYEESKYKPPPISGTIEDRCMIALEHVCHGLECIKFFPTEEESEEERKNEEEQEKEKKEYEENHLNMAKRFQAIPMPYASLKEGKKGLKSEGTNSGHKKKTRQKKNKKSDKFVLREERMDNEAQALCKPKAETLPTWQAPQKSNNISWSAHLKTLLYEKASLIFAVLAENEYVNRNYGASLRYMLAVFRCQKILEVLCGLRNDKSTSYLLGRAGDCCLMTVHDWCNIKKHRTDYETKNTTAEKIVEELYKMEDLNINGVEVLPQHLDTLESTLLASYMCYTTALSLEPREVDKNNLVTRLGNIHNELGVFYMNQAGICYEQQNSFEDASESLAAATALLTRSLTYLEAGVKVFETVHDKENLVRLHSNTGRFMRLSAHIHAKQNSQECHFLSEACVCYQKALLVLRSRKSNPVIWDTVTWDLSTTLYNMATLLENYLPYCGKKEQDFERELIDVFQKVLKLCDTETPGPRQVVYQFRAATVHHRVAALYQRVYREYETDTDNIKRKTSLQLCKLHYDDAANLLLTLKQIPKFLTVQMERIALEEHQASCATTFKGELKGYLTGLQLLLQCRPVIDMLCERNNAQKEKGENASTAENKVEKEETEEGEDVDEHALTEDEESVVTLFELKLQFFLRSLSKLFATQSSSKNKKEFEALATLYKQCYSRSLRTVTMTGFTLVEHIAQLLKELFKMLWRTES